MLKEHHPKLPWNVEGTLQGADRNEEEFKSQLRSIESLIAKMTMMRVTL